MALSALFNGVATVHAATYRGEIQLDKATTVVPADHRTLFLKRIAIEITSDDSMLKETTLNPDSIESAITQESNDDPCEPESEILTTTGAQSGLALQVKLSDTDDNKIVFNNSIDARINATQSYERTLTNARQVGFDSQLKSDIILRSEPLTVLVNLSNAPVSSTYSRQQEIIVEITQITMTSQAVIDRDLKLLGLQFPMARVYYRAYPKGQNPLDPMELVTGSTQIPLL